MRQHGFCALGGSLRVNERLTFANRQKQRRSHHKVVDLLDNLCVRVLFQSKQPGLRDIPELPEDLQDIVLGHFSVAVLGHIAVAGIDDRVNVNAGSNGSKLH